MSGPSRRRPDPRRGAAPVIELIGSAADQCDPDPCVCAVVVASDDVRPSTEAAMRRARRHESIQEQEV